MSVLTSTALPNIVLSNSDVLIIPKTISKITPQNISQTIPQIITPSPSVQHNFFARLQSAAVEINDQFKQQENPSTSLNNAQISLNSDNVSVNRN